MSFLNNSFGNNAQLSNPRPGSPQTGGFSEDMLNFNGAGMSRPMTNGMMGSAMGSALGSAMGSQGLLGNSFGVQPQGDMHAAVMEDASRYLSQGGGQFVPELDMMALLRAKQKLNMMNRGTGQAAASASVQDKIRAYTQDQFSKGQGLPMARPEDFQVSSAMIDKLKRSSDEMNSEDPDGDEPKGKKRKKTKKPNDMPRRALSAYNIFFSEQRELILREIEKKDTNKDGEDDDKSSSKKEDDAEVPSVMNRTFFPTRAKRAHRKVHGKIGLVSLAREVSSRWKALDPEKRKHYQDLAEKDREQHKKVMADYQERKAAENMISLGSPKQESQEAPGNQMLRLKATEQDLRDTMAQQYQQKALHEMMAAQSQAAAAAAVHQQQPSQQAMMHMGGMMGMGGMGGGVMSQRFNGFGVSQPSNLGFQSDPSLLGLNPNDYQSRAQMWQQMGMGGMGGMGSF